MISRYEVVLNGQSMSEIDERLLILDVNYPDHEYEMQTSTPAGSESTIVDNRKKGKASVTVTFELHVYDIAERQEVLQRVIAWCKNGGTLQVNDRPEQRLNAICENIPALGSVRDWTSPLAIVFSAYTIPYWEDIEETSVSLQGSNTSRTIAVPGLAGETPVNVEITSSQTITAFAVGAGSNTINVKGISCPPNTPIRIGHDANGLLYIRQNNTSILNKRTAESSDDLKVPCGGNARISVTASASVTAKFSIRGYWL